MCVKTQIIINCTS